MNRRQWRGTSRKGPTQAALYLVQEEVTAIWGGGWERVRKWFRVLPYSWLTLFPGKLKNRYEGKDD